MGGDQPKDELGGQFASFSYSPPPPTFDYGALGKGFQQLGAGIAGGADTHNYMTGSTIPSQQNYQGSTLPETLIPSSSGGTDIMAILQRLLSQGGGY